MKTKTPDSLFEHQAPEPQLATHRTGSNLVATLIVIAAVAVAGATFLFLL